MSQLSIAIDAKIYNVRLMLSWLRQTSSLIIGGYEGGQLDMVIEEQGSIWKDGFEKGSTSTDRYTKDLEDMLGRIVSLFANGMLRDKAPITFNDMWVEAKALLERTPVRH